MSISKEEWNRYKTKIDRLDDYFFEEGLDGRSGEADLQLLRLVIHRFRSAKFFLGIMIGILTVGVPAIYGVIKLVEIIRAYLKGG
jgi:hypothetical protein